MSNLNKFIPKVIKEGKEGKELFEKQEELLKLKNDKEREEQIEERNREIDERIKRAEEKRLKKIELQRAEKEQEEIKKEILKANNKKLKLSKKVEKKDISMSLELPKDMELHLQAVRRRKIRELRDMGYAVEEMVRILNNGIVVNGIKKGLGVITKKIVYGDLSYITSEDLATDKEFPEKKAEIMSKYNFLYKKVLSLALDGDLQSRAAFFNVAKSILDRISVLEGLENPERHDIRLLSIKRPALLAEEFQEKLTEEERNAINTTITKILADGNKESN